MNNNLFTSSDHTPILKIVQFGQTGVRVASWNMLFEKWLRMNVDAKDREAGQIVPRGGHIGKYFPQLVGTKLDERSLSSLFTVASLIKTQEVDIFALQEFDYLTSMSDPDIAIHQTREILDHRPSCSSRFRSPCRVRTRAERQ